MNKQFLIPMAAALFSFAGCDDSGPAGTPQQASEEDSGGGGVSHSSSGGGSGDVKLDGGPQGTIADRYEKALSLIRERDWDGARDQLLEALRRSGGDDIKSEIKEHLKLVDQGIISQPTHTVDSIFQNAKNFYEKKVSMRGRFIPGGAVGKVSYYFWIQHGRKIQVRYGSLSLEEKKKILLLKEGGQVLVRGTLKSPWGSNPNPYLEASFFRIEKLPPRMDEPE